MLLFANLGVDVAKSATVGDLKHSVEDAFSNFGPDKVSWYIFIHHFFTRSLF